MDIRIVIDFSPAALSAIQDLTRMITHKEATTQRQWFTPEELREKATIAEQEHKAHMEGMGGVSLQQGAALVAAAGEALKPTPDETKLVQLSPQQRGAETKAKKAAAAKAEEPAPADQSIGVAYPTDAPDVVGVTLARVQELSRKIAQAGKADQIKALLSDFGVAKITAIDAADLDAFYSQLKAL